VTDTVTVFVKLAGGAFPGTIESDIRVYAGNAPGRINISLPGWVRFSEVPVQPIPTMMLRDETDDTGDTTT